MKIIALIASALTVLNVANGQFRPGMTSTPGMTVIGSVTGQFFVSARGSLSPHSLELASSPDMITLEPALLAISCERIKRELLHELNVADQWQGKIFVVLRPTRSMDDPTRVVAQKLGGHWDCSVELPDALNRNRFVETMVRANLLEIANRNAGGQSTEIPEWLVRGFTRQLMGSSEIKLILPPPRTLVNGLSVSRETMDFSDTPHKSSRATRKLNPLAEAAEILRTNAPLSFDELSWPTDEQLSENDADVFGSSAQLFVNRLLHLNKGPQCLRAMLAEMPNYLNWQLAFQDAFRGTFEKPLDVEKWWALELAQFSGRDLLHLLTPEESVRQLDAVFEFPIEVQIGMAPAMRTGISFQTIIRGWSRPRQQQILKAKLWELEVLRLRLSPEFVPLLDEYRQVLQDYYKKRSASVRILASIGILPDKSVEEAVNRLDVLDVRRGEMRQKIETSMASAMETAPMPTP